jgi:hypothetical protein
MCRSAGPSAATVISAMLYILKQMAEQWLDALTEEIQADRDQSTAEDDLYRRRYTDQSFCMRS